ncbi:MAG: SPASM domain-containing protein, partial [Candidatus Melainabacteria bacterium]|nr:SPASM domain-containing protein [Candidatus Melainabacteria bacterium]
AGCNIGLITNGSKFNESNSRALLEANIDMIEFSVDACDPQNYAIVRKGLSWGLLLANVTRMLRIRNEIKGVSKIIASGVNQKQVNIDDVEKFWVEEIGVDYFIKRKFLTWGTNTTLDDLRSADPSPYLNTDEVPCPFIFERLNIDSRGNVMVCGYDIAANTSLSNVTVETIKDIWHGQGFRYYREKHLAKHGKEIEICAQCPDWQYRSWQHNYWKVVANAEEVRIKKLMNLV